MLVELAIGDAYGAGFEYVSSKVVERLNDLTGYVPHEWHSIRPGSYTDDTQMSIAIAEAILSDQPWNPEMLAERFIVAYHRDPREGYSKRTSQLLKSSHTAAEFLARVQTDSEKSGAAMRACPIGVYDSVETVMERARVQAQMTHATQGASDAAAVAALMTHYFLYRIGPKNDLGRFLTSLVPGPWETDWTGRVGSKGITSMHAAVTAVRTSDTLTGLLKACVDFSGDVDTVAAVALGAAAGSIEIEQDLPSHLYQRLERLENGEQGKFGLDYLAKLDQCLQSRVRSTPQSSPLSDDLTESP